MNGALVRALVISAGVTGLLVGAVGFAHTTTGRPLVGAFTRMAHGGCPFGYDKPMTPAERERQRANFSLAHRGSGRAGSRPALGFALDQTTRAEIVATLAKHGVLCTAAKGLSDLTCNGVPSSALDGAPATARNLWLTFGEHDRLLSVVAISRAPNAAAISSTFVQTKQELDQAAGAASQTQGDPAPEALAKGALRQASAEFRFSDYYALERATNLGSGYALTEEYRSLAD